MRVTRKPRRTPELDLLAFADVAFLMIIFFILTTTFTGNVGHLLALPSGTPDTQEEKDEMITVRLTRDQILFQGQTPGVDMEGLRERLGDAQLYARPENERMVLVQSEPDVSCERYFQVVMAITRQGGVLALLEEEREAM
ncbi:MAG: biopolymer transporter ExbD [Verrucomicrobia bacterium]|nr:biopolymer transporter ExbD [Verrucomicrobiota bacterium]